MSVKSSEPLDLTCEPLSCLKDITAFLATPPAWTSLAEPLKQNHSEFAVVNSTVRCSEDDTQFTQTFCHVNNEDMKSVKRQRLKKLPRTLICHDYANGYHDDSKIEGTTNHNAYAFYNWSGIDIFCYFSHSFVTIPPIGWINVAHAHGVKVIGTMITEWSQGSELWEYVLSDPDMAQNLASALVAIAKLLKFEGWLLNIENKVMYPDRLVMFVQMLHKELHSEIPNAELIWYDSVTADGTLNWQNKLNDRNRVFFDSCDGIFTNYSWTETDVEESAVAAGERRRDVYIGVDIWGRNFFGGGQFNTYRAVLVARSNDCSVAIFAPGWTHEVVSEKMDEEHIVINGEDLSVYDKFLLRDRALWTSIWPFLNTKLPSELPFQTSFCRGQGLKRRIYGEVICPSPWYNLRHMKYQPNSNFSRHRYTLLSVEPPAKEKSRAAERTGIISVAAPTPNPSTGDPARAVSSELGRTPSVKSETSRVTGDSKEIKVEQQKTPSAEDLNHDRKLEPNPVCQSNASIQTNQDTQTTENYSKHPGAADLEAIKNKEIHDDTKTTLMHNIGNIVSKKKHSKSDIAGTSADDDDIQYRAVTASLQMRLKIDAGKRRYQIMYKDDDRECLQPYFLDSFTGGSCLCVYPSDEGDSGHRTARLFHTDFSVKDYVLICLVTKTPPSVKEQHYLDVELVFDSSGQERRVLLLEKQSTAATDPSGDNVVYPINDKPEFDELRKFILTTFPDFYVPVENSYGWRINYFLSWTRDEHLTSVLCRTQKPGAPVLLGHFGICQLPVSSPLLTNILPTDK